MHIIVNIWLYESFLWNINIGYVYLPTMSQKKEPEITVYSKPIMSFYGIMPNNQHVRIFHDKYSKLDRHCVALKNIVDNHFKET